MNVLLLWIGCGLGAVVIAAFVDYCSLGKDESRCPSPEKITLGLFIIACGPVGLIFAILGLVFIGGEAIIDRCSRNRNFMEWWENPICSWGSKK